MEEKTKHLTKPSPPKTTNERISGLDLSFQGIKSVSSSLFLLSSIKELSLNNNELENIPKDIYKLRNLEKLNLSHNKLKNVPPELGKAVSLRELYLNDNFITNVPMELGGLYNLEILNLQNNPLVTPFNTLSRDKSLIHFCRENNTSYNPPADRAWIDTILNKEYSSNAISVGTYNILCNFYAAKCTYAPSWVLNSELRKENIFQNIASYNVDILALQEIESSLYNDFYSEQLKIKLDYDSAFYPKNNSTIGVDPGNIHGCATFWKKDKFKLIERINVNLQQKILTDDRFKSNPIILDRNTKKDNVALILVLEDNNMIPIVVVNVHVYWNPDYADVKLFQIILILEEIEKIRQKYKNSPIIFLGDFNSLVGSSIYNLIVERKTNGSDFGLYDFSPFNSGFRHSLRFYDSYKDQDLTFTNFTPTFREVIDYIFYTDNLILTGVLSPIEEEYADQCVGLPNIHFPSDHIFIGAKLSLKTNIKDFKPSK